MLPFGLHPASGSEEPLARRAVSTREGKGGKEEFALCSTAPERLEDGWPNHPHQETLLSEPLEWWDGPG